MTRATVSEDASATARVADRRDAGRYQGAQPAQHTDYEYSTYKCSTGRGMLIMIGRLLQTPVRGTRFEELANRFRHGIRRCLRAVLDLVFPTSHQLVGDVASASEYQALAMTKPNDEKQYALACLRLAADCRGLAADVTAPDLKARLLRQAGDWEALANKASTGSRPA